MIPLLISEAPPLRLAEPAAVRQPRLARVLREPILHFLLLGALLHLAGRWWFKPVVVRETRIEVPAAEARRLREVWAVQWHRPPSPEELQSLVDDYVREEVLVREAIAMGLDRDDDIVRRRLVQKMEFLAQGAPQEESNGEGVD